MTEEELVEAVVAGFERSEYVATWPQDEIDFFRDYDAWEDFTDRRVKLQAMRARKIIAMIRESGVDSGKQEDYAVGKTKNERMQ